MKNQKDRSGFADRPPVFSLERDLVRWRYPKVTAHLESVLVDNRTTPETWAEYTAVLMTLELHVQRLAFKNLGGREGQQIFGDERDDLATD